MRLIDGDELYRKVVGYNGGAVDKTVAKRLIDQMPTVDAISRQAAIDALGVEPLAYTDYEEGLHTKWADAKEALKKLPSAQPEIVMCKDCKHGMYDAMCKFYWCHGVAHSANWFCADAERRDNGND